MMSTAEGQRSVSLSRSYVSTNWVAVSKIYKEKKQARNCIKSGTVSSSEQTMPGRRLRYTSCIKPGSSVLSNTEQTMPGKRTGDVYVTSHILVRIASRLSALYLGVVGNVNEYDAL
ncbi:hypothetical protein DPMN_096207 [Dreissena polymorpha]|uniref:Uncharacterized protein n=1 Tax=Dreissena polymorpha TaxID=45954 RepID=A0A9D4L903_DREPO|nr:hypothetical protein DPMN_096207 [Dreissena polymorpha]